VSASQLYWVLYCTRILRQDEKLMAALVANRQRDHHENDCCRRARGSRRMTSDARDHVTQQVRSPVNHSLFVCLSLSLISQLQRHGPYTSLSLMHWCVRTNVVVCELTFSDDHSNDRIDVTGHHFW